MHRSKIEWVLNPDNKTLGWIWNPITGCLNGCEYCYARRLAEGRLRERYLANKNTAPLPIGVNLLDIDIDSPFYPRFWEERMPKDRLCQVSMIKRLKPMGIFVCDMGELFGDWIPREWQEKIFKTINMHPEHRFYLLTKQPQNLIKWSPFPGNCWVGVTATDFKMFAYATLYLGQIEAKVKYVSFEPLLGRIGTDVKGGYGSEFLADDIKQFLDWLIIGAQTKPTVYPKIEWVEEIVRAGDKAGIPVFLKDNLGGMDMRGEWDRDLWLGKNLQLRQELPTQGVE